VVFVEHLASLSHVFDDVVSEYHRSKYGSHVRSKKVGTHTGNVTYVITYVISNSRRVTWIIFWNSGFNFTYKVSSNIGSFSIDTTSYTGEKCNRLSTQ